MDAASPTVWLRGNVRPVAGLAAAVGVCNLAALAIVGMVGAGVVGWWVVAAFAVASAVAVAAFARSAGRPRLERAGTTLRVRLAPGRMADVPLDAVECFFMGSHVVGGATDDAVRWRVGTLVMRIAERAQAWQARPTLAAWGSWRDGAVVFDGQWCEPLSPELGRRLSGWLVEAKRSAATSSGGETVA